MSKYTNLYVLINREVREPSPGPARRETYAQVERALSAELHKAKGRYLDSVVGDIRDFYAEAQRHYNRIAYQEAIAARLGRNPRSIEDMATLWHEVAKAMNVRDKLSGEWKSGLVDPNVDYAIDYWPTVCDYAASYPPILSNDPLERVRTGIARTLMFIALYPPLAEIEDRLPATAVPPEFRRCWQALREHPCFCKRKGQINQHALDSVREMLGPSHWIEPQAIGKMKQEMETLLWDTEDTDHPYLLPWLLFKFATSADVRPIIRLKTNENAWLWHEHHPAHAALWRVYP
jgi:hypothetical protein